MSLFVRIRLVIVHYFIPFTDIDYRPVHVYRAFFAQGSGMTAYQAGFTGNKPVAKFLM